MNSFKKIILIELVWFAVVSRAQSNKITLSSSSNFKAMEGFAFDVTCQFDDDSNVSFEFILPNGDRAANNSFLSLGKPWKTNSMELKITKAIRSRDRGSYKCIVNGFEVAFKIEFVSEAFLYISTPNPVIAITENNSTFDMIIDVVALPFPRFFFAFDGYSGVDSGHFKHLFGDPSILASMSVIANDRISPTQCIMSIDFAYFWYSGEYTFTVRANNTERAGSCTFNVTYKNDDPPHISGVYKSDLEHPSASDWEQINDIKLFSSFENDEPFEEIHYTADAITDFDDRINIAIRVFSLSLPLLVSWILQPCTISGCIALSNLTDESKIIGGTITLNTTMRTELHLQINPPIPGNLYVLAQNDHSNSSRKISLRFSSLRIVTEGIWNPYLGRNEATIGSGVVFECRVSFPLQINWRRRWRQGEKLIDLDDSDWNRIVASNQPQTTDAYFIESRLEANCICSNDVESYSCDGAMRNGKPNDIEVHAVRNQKPEIQSNFGHKPDHRMELGVGESFELICTVDDHENLSIRSFIWLKHGEPIASELQSENDGKKSYNRYRNTKYSISKRLSNLTEDDEGNYSCVAINVFGRDEHFVLVSIHKPPRDYKYFLMATAVVILIMTFVILVLRARYKWAAKQISELKAAGLANFEEGNLASVNKNLCVNEQADLLPYDPRFEFKRDDLVLKEQLGSGAFGVVFKAIAVGIKSTELETIVAVKTVSKIASNEMLRALVVELKIMVHMGQHLNIANLLGAVTKNIAKRDLMVIVEYCCFGDLENFLKRNRALFSTGVRRTEPSNSGYSAFVPKTAFDTSNLISWSFQVACGMDYLSSKKVLHGDLAGRNVLLCPDNIVKICDFGLAKSLYQNDVYKKQERTLLPYKWLAIESLVENTFSVYSDIWAYGVLVWEIFSLGQPPYPEIIGFESLLKKLQKGHRLAKPEFAPDSVHDIMLECWKVERKQRPLFAELKQRFGDMMHGSERKNLIDLNEPCSRANQESISTGRIDLAALWTQDDEEEPERSEIGQNTYESLVMSDYSKPKLI